MDDTTDLSCSQQAHQSSSSTIIHPYYCLALPGPLRGTGVWKMPTGLLDAGEDIGKGAEREVKEETGVDAR